MTGSDPDLRVSLESEIQKGEAATGLSPSLCLIGVLALASLGAKGQDSVAGLPLKPEWGRFTVMVWQYQHDLRRVSALYEQLGLHAFHIDYGANEGELVRYAKSKGWPYYVDHAAGKGLLHLTPRSGVERILRSLRPVARPFSLADPKTLRALKDQLRRNIEVTRQGPVLAYAFDDEISLGSFASAVEVDASPAAVAWFQTWVMKRYESCGALNKQWGTSYGDFSKIGPQGFESLRQRHQTPAFSTWNLSRWMDWRSGMDALFAATLRRLVGYANGLDPKTPAGFVGGSHPAPWGGFDYERLTRSVQWMEAYDVCGNTEIIRSLWRGKSKPWVQTWFSRGRAGEDSWFLWRHLLHGARGVVAWPQTRGRPWFDSKRGLPPHLLSMASCLKEVQGPISELILDPAARFDPDPIAILYSHPSVQASWVLDASSHGRTWPHRSNSLDADNQSSGWNRIAWFSILEDLGYQYQVVTPSQLEKGELDGAKVLILPRVIALSDASARAAEAFVAKGGHLIADHLCGVLDEHGRGRPKGALDGLFGLRRKESRGLLGGRFLCEIDAELYQQPFEKRLRYGGALHHGRLTIYERGTLALPGSRTPKEDRGVLIRRPHEKGSSVYLNLTPLPYVIPRHRRGDVGAALRRIVGQELRDAGLAPRLEIRDREGHEVIGVEALWWRLKDGRQLLGLVANPIQRGAQDTARGAPGIQDLPRILKLEFKDPTEAFDLRRNATVPITGRSATVEWVPWEAAIFRITKP